MSDVLFGPRLVGGIGAGDDLTLVSTEDATKGQLVFGTSVYDEANDRLGIDIDTPLSVIHLVDTGAAVTAFYADRFSNDATGVGFTFRKARGTPSVPVAANALDTIGFMGAIAYHSGGAYGLAASFVYLAAEAQTLTNQGKLAILQTTPIGSATAATRMAWTPGGNILIGTGLVDPTTGSQALIFQDGTAPTGLPANTAGLFANDVGGTVHMFAIDEAGVTFDLNPTLDALGGGAAPTLGTIGGAGPTVAAQNTWMRLNRGGTNFWVPVWV